MSDYVSEYYQPFGVKTFHDAGFYGKYMDGATEVKIKLYIIDTGLDDADPLTPGVQTHLDLQGVITVRNFSNEAGSRTKPSHGSLTASLVAAPANNFGIIGVCPDADIYLADVDNSDEKLYQTNVVNAIADAIATNVDIICIPLGTVDFIPSLQTAIADAVAAGIYIFASCGNSGLLRYEYPASFTGVISVGSVNLDKQLSTFNTRNEKVAVFAPGENYYLPSNLGPVLATGTSFSAPFAAGLAALHLSKERSTTPTYKPTRQELITVLRSETLLDNGTLGYPSIATEEESLFGSLSSILPVFGGFLVGALILYFIAGALEKNRMKALAKKAQEEIA